MNALLQLIEESLSFWCQNCGVQRVVLDHAIPGDIVCSKCRLVLVTFHAIGSTGEGLAMGALSKTERDAVMEDLAELLRALGLGDHARPESPHEVMQQCIREVTRVRDLLAERTEALEVAVGQMGDPR